MESSRLHLIILFSSVFPFCLVNLCLSQVDGFGFHYNCYADQQFAGGSTYETNLNNIFSELITSNFNYGFHSLSSGSGSDTVNLIALCRGDQSDTCCDSCLLKTVAKLKQSCSSSREAIGWSEKCSLHYSDQEISGIMTTTPNISGSSNLPWNGSYFNQAVALLKTLSSNAAAGDSSRKYAADNMVVGDGQRAYGLVQCTPDLSETNCSSCLTTAIVVAQSVCNNKSGCRVLQPSCNLRYENSSLFGGCGISEDGFGFHYNCYADQQFAGGSTYETNLNNIFSELTTSNFNYGFHSLSSGSGSDKVNSIALCRGDQSDTFCDSCLLETVANLKQSCSRSREAIGWLEKCSLHYSDQEISGIMTTTPNISGSSNLPWNDSYFDQAVALLKTLSSTAAAGGSSRKYAVDNLDVGSGQRAYGLVQCTPDLSDTDCSSCLTTAIVVAESACTDMSGCRVLQPSCNLRYENSSFFGGFGFSEDGFGFQFNCYDHQSFTSGSTYGTNLVQLFSRLSTSEFNHGFYNMSVGISPNKISLIGLCRPDQLEDDCNSCLKDVVSRLEQSCPNNVATVGWLEKCALRYSNKEIFGVMSTEPSIDGSSNTPWTPSKFNQTVTLLNQLSSRAAEGDNVRKYAGGNVTVGDGESAYALVQCTPDLSQTDCSKCLTTAIEKVLKGSCNVTTGCRVLQPSCNLRYERNKFYEDVPNVAQPSPSPFSSLPSPL